MRELKVNLAMRELSNYNKSFFYIFKVNNPLVSIVSMVCDCIEKDNFYYGHRSSFFLAPAVTVGKTEGAMDSAAVLFFTSSFAYNFARK